MHPIDSLDDFQKALDEVAAALIGFVREKRNGQPWRLALADVRCPPDGSSRIGKLMVELEDGRIDASSQLPTDLATGCYHIWTGMNKLFPQPSYGIKITLFPDSGCEVEYNSGP